MLKQEGRIWGRLSIGGNFDHARSISILRMASLYLLTNRLIILRSPHPLQAVRTIEQGHIRVGPTPITDPAMMITRNMEDFITWVDGSSRKRTIAKYNDEVSLECLGWRKVGKASTMLTGFCFFNFA